MPQIIMAGAKRQNIYEWALVHTGDKLRPYTLALNYNPAKGEATLCQDYASLDQAVVAMFDMNYMP